MEQQHTEFDSLKTLIDTLYGINIMRTSRERKIVDARFIYAKILRERGYTLQSIGNSLKKDHTTILHYITQSDNLMKYDNLFAEKYTTCKSYFLRDNPIYSKEMKEIDLVNMIKKILKENELLLFERNEILKKVQSFKRIEPIMELISKKVPEGQEKTIEEKIKHLFKSFCKNE